MPMGKLLWVPEPAFARKTNIAAYMKWLEKRGQKFSGYGDLWTWSVDDLEGFWGSVWKYFDVAEADYPVLAERRMPGARWFEGSELNFAEYVFRKGRAGGALISKSERKQPRTVTWQELEKRTAALAADLKEKGVEPGDRVAGYLPNSPEAVTAFLACASIGAIWSCCSPDFGAPAVIDRFSQIGPKVLVAADGYSYGGKWFDRRGELNSIVKALPTLGRTIHVRGAEGAAIAGADSWEDAVSGKANPEYESLPFDHPLWILYSSGTTGLPKPIVHGHGGILVQLLKEVGFHTDIRGGDRFFWFTTTGWMMWNYMVGGLLHGATMVLYSGSPSFPDLDSLWELAERTQTTFMGGSASYFESCLKAGLEPKSSHSLSKLRGIGSTGSPLSTDSFEWVYSAVKEDVWLASVSGGTDVCSPFVGGCPILPVHSGEIQCRSLGSKVQAFDEAGNPVVGQVGELVLTEPIPSMPLYLWGDKDGSRYKESYFSVYPGVWRHGDWIEITKRGSCVIYGRSDATIKRMGVRIGTSEIYRAVESLPEVADSMAVEVEGPAGEGQMVLFVATAQGEMIGKDLEERIRAKIRADISPRYVPDMIVQAPKIPRTLNGKKMEVPVKKVLLGGDPSKVLNLGAVSDPASLDFFIQLARSGSVGGRKLGRPDVGAAAEGN
ncbi:MAG: acetoacetate--CoA ligase [Nitrososphaerota archaeon]|nr:acetoacetate--CoA ligase [Nitrososphaerota archaeon]MDG7024485.1 acetoacetate--CoA ligase [Nitrososphaerota archaeon]